jgi:hypothetical protein
MPKFTDDMYLQSFFVNRFRVRTDDLTARITFGEAMENGAALYSNSVTLSRDNALKLADLLNKVLAEPEDDPKVVDLLKKG